MESAESLDLEFKKLWLAVKRRWLPGSIVFCTTVGLAVVASSFLKSSYEAKGKLLFKLNRTPSLTGLGQEIGDVNPLSTSSNPINTELEIIRSIPLAQETIATLNLKDSKGHPLKPEKLLSTLKAKNISGADVVGLSYKSRDPKEAAAVVNKVMELYIKNNISNNRAEAVAAQKFIAEQLPKAEASVNQAEVALWQFKEKNQVIALDNEAKSAVQVIANLDERISQVQAELKDANIRVAELQQTVSMNSQDAITTASLSQSSGVQEALKEFQAVQAQLAVQQTRFQDDNPIIINLKEKEAALNSVLQDRIKQTIGGQQQVPTRNLQIGSLKEQLTSDFVKAKVESLGLAGRLAELSNTKTAYKQKLTIVPKLEKDQRELQRILDAAQSTYQTLLKKLQEVQVAENQNIGNARIIEKALVPDKPSSKGKLIILLLGFVAGSLLFIVTVIFLELRDTSIKTLKEVKELFGYTLLGTIPSFGKKTRSRIKDQERITPELPVRDNPRALSSEAYRMLQANLKFLSSDKPLQLIVVTSSVPKEGKSQVSANLATAIAQLGRRVLLVDADLRHPLQHHIWELTNAGGLSDVLVGQADFNAVVARVIDNLDVLCSGVIPPNPLALLDSKRMATLIEYFSEHYDFVILDAPPLVLAADALTLGKMTDGVLLVARPGVVDSNSASAAKESLERSAQKVLGLVVNGVIVENESDSYFYDAREYFTEKDSKAHEKVTSRIET